MNFLLILLSLIYTPEAEPVDSIMLGNIDVVESTKLNDEEKGNYSSTHLGRADLEYRHITSLKEATSVAPNFYQADYGSSMTSSIYVRGFGSRIDQPVVGLNIDGMPILNKNNYDFEFFDIASLQIIRGAQSTLFGRNTSGGTINIKTLSPLVFQGKRLLLEYGNENALRIKASHYGKPNDRFGWGVSLHYSHKDGFFMNRERGEKCDGGDNMGIRLRLQWLTAENWSFDNTLSFGYTDEGGYAYRRYDAVTGTLAPVAYNDACTYRRFNITEAFTAKRYYKDFTMVSTTGFNFTNDRMRMDNDFTPLNYFSMGQYQKEHSITQEIVVKSSQEKTFKWLGGISAFYKRQSLDAPVFFKQDGIKKLILDNANEMLFDNAPGYSLAFGETSFPIEDKFTIPAYGFALFGETGYSIGDFDIKAGLRIDYEYSSMDYNSYAELHYKYLEASNEYKYLKSVFKGDNSTDAIELLPHIALSYRHAAGNTYISVARGFKAGGFNTQLFSDILRNKLTIDIWDDMYNRPSTWKDDGAIATVYKPETSWNYEIGTHLSPLADGSLQISAALFFIDCHDQQLTIHPKGATGRMMSNAGHSQSYGGEVSISYTIGDITVEGAYGYTHATFKKFVDGDKNYRGNSLPYAPRETVSANLCYNIPVPRSFANFLKLNIGWNGVGRIYWNEANTLTQAFYGLLSASLTWEKGHFGASLWGKNLLDEEYNTFYFQSIGNNFFSRGKPLQAGISLHLNL